VRLTHRRVWTVLDNLEYRPRPSKTTLEAVDQYLVLDLGISTEAVPRSVKKALARAVEQIIVSLEE
jgi:hypothetical protein